MNTNTPEVHFNLVLRNKVSTYAVLVLHTIDSCQRVHHSFPLSSKHSISAGGFVPSKPRIEATFWLTTGNSYNSRILRLPQTEHASQSLTFGPVSKAWHVHSIPYETLRTGLGRTFLWGKYSRRHYTFKFSPRPGPPLSRRVGASIGLPHQDPFPAALN